MSIKKEKIKGDEKIPEKNSRTLSRKRAEKAMKESMPAGKEKSGEDKKSREKITARRKKAVEQKVEIVKVEEENARREEELFAKWTERDFLRIPEEVLMYKLAFAAGVFAMLWALRDGSLLSALTFLILLAVIMFELKTEQKMIEYEINIDGISIDGRLYRFEEIRSFDLMERAGENIVRFQLKNAFFPMKDMVLGGGYDPDFIEALLEYFLPKEKQEDMILSFKGEKTMTEDEFIDRQVEEYLKDNS